MSVVNKMLQDLEARQSHTDEINADYQPPPKKSSRLLILALLILAMGAIIFALTDNNLLFDESTNKPVATKTNTQPLPAVVAKKMTVVPEKLLPQQQVQAQMASVPSPIAEIEVVVTANEIALPKTVLTDEPTLPQGSNTATVALVPVQKANIETKPIESQVSSQLNPNVATEQTSSFSMTGSSEENNRSSLKQRIAESLNNDNLDLSRSLLYELLETEPDNIKARKKLASLLFAQGNYAQSKQLLVQGIELHPTQNDMRLMLARLYVVQKEPSQAMTVLVDFQPGVDNPSEYLAYRASLAQQLKQTELARSDYLTLTNIESTNAKWWLGLGIAADQLGEINMAVQAYSRAQSLGQLDSSVNQFMQQRISVLAGAQ